MKALIPLLIAFAFAPAAFAQDTTVAPMTPPLRQAPIGHRQPTVASVHKAEEEKGSKGAGAPTKPQNGTSPIDQKLIICKGC
jgi:hypothetical protein